MFNNKMFNNVLKSAALFIGLSISLGILVIGIMSLRSYFTKASSNSSEPQSIAAANITDSQAQITWTTEQETQGLVRYATDPTSFKLGNTSGLLFAAEEDSGKTHQVKLSLLKPNTTYYYELSIGSNIYGQSGLVKDETHLPFSFTTAAGSTSQTTQNQLPTLDADTFKKKFGTTDPVYDLNKDGTVNSTDYLIYLQRTKTATPKP